MGGAEVPCCEIAEKPVSGKGGKPTVSNGETKADVPEKREKKRRHREAGMLIAATSKRVGFILPVFRASLTTTGHSRPATHKAVAMQPNSFPVSLLFSFIYCISFPVLPSVSELRIIHAFPTIHSSGRNPQYRESLESSTRSPPTK